MSPHLPARQVYHLADAANWASIQRLGLLSASRLMDLAGLTAAERERIECAQRQASITLPTGAVPRDQVPMPPAALVRCLIGMTPAEWYALVNSKVFFWFDPGRLDRQRRAGAASSRAVVMTIDAERLLAAHGARAAAGRASCPMPPGSMAVGPARPQRSAPGPARPATRQRS